MAGVAGLSGKGITPLGHTVAHSGAQAAAQQSMSWCPPCMSLAAIGQSARGTANAGPDETARASANRKKANKRRMPGS